MKRLLLCGAVILLSTTSARAEAPSDLAGSIGTLKSVTNGDQGNAEAQQAWRRVSAADASALPTLLAALDDAGPLAANWLRSAIDAVAERTVTAGGKLPADALEKFVVDRHHSARARRLAYELLCSADSAAEARLLPSMLDDPSLELRRDAVARVESAAEEQIKAGDRTAGAETLRRAVNAARDPDQVQQIVKRLDELGVKIDIAEQFGYVRTWKLLGPFDNTNEQGFDVIYPVEEKVEFASEYPGKAGAIRWIDHSSDDATGKIDFNTVVGKANSVVGYGAAEFVADAARPIELRWQTMNATKVWLNGKLLAAHRVYHAGTQMDQYIASGDLKAGPNLILVKLCQNEQKDEWAQGWDLRLRVCDETGAAVHSTKAAAQPAAAATTPAS